MHRFTTTHHAQLSRWMSCVEFALQRQHPEKSLAEIRQSNIMQGVYTHAKAASAKKTVPAPTTLAVATPIDHYAYTSQMLFSTPMDSTDYNQFLSDVLTYNNDNGIRNFSDEDVFGFALCLAVWAGMGSFSTIDRTFIEGIISFLESYLDVPDNISDDLDNIYDYANDHFSGKHIQYSSVTGNSDTSPFIKNSSNQTWTLDNDARIIMLGDWGTSNDDAKQLLKSIWKYVWQQHNSRQIVIMHLGDIYYAGLPTECQNNFFNVITAAGSELLTELGNTFNPHIPVFTIPGNHEYYSYGYGYFQLLTSLNGSGSGCIQNKSFFCVRTHDSKWQFLGMDTGQDDYNALVSGLSSDPTGYSAVADYDEDYLDCPKLKSSEASWHNARIDEFSGQTILLSHHQLFSRAGRLRYKDPTYLNPYLYSTFGPHFKDKIAAWFWGHEHTYALFQDGLYGLNKGRLLGSSSYESNSADGEYANTNINIQLNADMKTPSKDSDGFYYHACAVIDLHRSSPDDPINVNYYQFPSWGQDETNSSAALSTLNSETISKTHAATTGAWAGNEPINDSNAATDGYPATVFHNNKIYVFFQENNGNRIMWMQYNTSTKSFSKSASLIEVGTNKSHLTCDHSPCAVIFQNKIYLLYVDDNTTNMKMATYDLGSNTWTDSGKFLSTTLFTSHSGAATVCGNNLYLTTIDASTNAVDLWYLDGSTLGWAGLGSVSGSSSSVPPAIATDGTLLYLAWGDASSNSHKISWCTYNPSTSSFSSAAHIQTSGTTVKYPQSNQGLSMIGDAQAIYLIYSDGDNADHIRWATYVISQRKWYGDISILSMHNNSVTNPQTKQTPTISVGNTNMGFVFYRGQSSSSIYYIYY
ncbi:MAG: metallophosphoesterase [Saprospiraceae bacterium]|nr:metallophosphoesterase [Saprospiraceae bacterium]